MKETIPTKKASSDIITVEVAKPKDAETLVEILSMGVKNKMAHGDMAWGSKPYTNEELHKRITEGNTYIASLGDEPVGTLLLIWDDEMMWGKQPPVAAYVHQLAIKDGYRGMNLGGQLLDWASNQAATRDRNLLRIDFPPENEGLKSYYEGLGFKWVKNRQIYTPHEIYTAALYERPTIQH